MTKNRRWLFLLLAAGLIALGAGGGTFATFNAQTANPGNSFATGTLYLSDAVSSTACFSFTGTNNQNTTSPTGCGTVIKVSGQEPGSGPNSNPVTGTVTLKNVGTLAGSLTASSSACVDTPLSASTTGNLTNSSATVTVASATGILVGMKVVDNTTGANLPTPDYVAGVSGTTITLTSAATATATGDSLKFSSASTGSLCGALGAYVTDGTTCYYGQCPTSAGGVETTTGNLTNTSSTISGLASATGIVVGMVVTDGTNPTYLPAGDTVTAVNGTTVTLSQPASGTSTADSLTFTAQPATLSNLSSATILNPGISLPSGSSTALTVGLYLPNGGSNGADNNLMGLESTFNLTFTLTQS